MPARSTRQEARALAGQLKDQLWAGQVDAVIATLQAHADRLGPPQATDGLEHPRRVLANNVGYFKAHRRHMDYPAYRGKGWPIGSGVTESAVKLFNKRVKGTEQFWSLPGVESILSLRNTPGSSTPGKVHVCPQSWLYAQPAWRKSDSTVSNCRQPMTILLGSVGSIAIEGSLAASPRMLLPNSSTLTWILLNGPRVHGPECSIAPGGGLDGLGIQGSSGTSR